MIGIDIRGSCILDKASRNKGEVVIYPWIWTLRWVTRRCYHLANMVKDQHKINSLTETLKGYKETMIIQVKDQTIVPSSTRNRYLKWVQFTKDRSIRKRRIVLICRHYSLPTNTSLRYIKYQLPIRGQYKGKRIRERQSHSILDQRANSYHPTRYQLF